MQLVESQRCRQGAGGGAQPGVSGLVVSLPWPGQHAQFPVSSLALSLTCLLSCPACSPTSLTGGRRPEGEVPLLHTPPQAAGHLNPKVAANFPGRDCYSNVDRAVSSEG